MWLHQINCGYYIPQFFEQSIDGSMLLKDLTDEILRNELNVKRLHISKILRKINELKIASKLENSLQIISNINEISIKKSEFINKKRLNLEERILELKHNYV